MNKVISFGKYRNKSISELINDKHYYQWLMKQDNLKIKYKKDFESIEDSFLSATTESNYRDFIDIPVNIASSSELEQIGQMFFEHWFIDFEFPDKNGKRYKSNNGKMVFSDEFKTNQYNLSFFSSAIDPTQTALSSIKFCPGTIELPNIF